MEPPNPPSTSARRAAVRLAVALWVAGVAVLAANLVFASDLPFAAVWISVAGFAVTTVTIGWFLVADLVEHRGAARAHEILRVAIDQSSAMVIVTDVRAGIVYVNARFTEVSGYTLSEVAGKNPRLWGSGRTPSAVFADLWRALTTLGRWHGELQNRNRDGSLLWVQASISAVRGPDGRTSHYLAVEEDITARKAAESDAARLRAELERRVAQRTDALLAANHDLEAFNYMLTHDIRRPLRAVLGLADILDDESADRLDDSVRECIAGITRACRRIDTLTEELLAFSKVGYVELRRVDVDVSALVSRIAAGLLAAEPERSARFEIADGLRAHGDPGLLRLVYDNLLHNAWKYSARKPETVIEVGVALHEGQPELYVRDNGAGFDPAFTESLFQPFKRLHSDREFEGTGVGLATVARVAKRHGGYVRGEGVAGQGAVFYLYLPDPGDGRFMDTPTPLPPPLRWEE